MGFLLADLQFSLSFYLPTYWIILAFILIYIRGWANSKGSSFEKIKLVPYACLWLRFVRNVRLPNGNL